MPQSQIFHNHQNYVVWYPQENMTMFSRLPPFNATPAPPPPPPPLHSHPGRVIRKSNQSDSKYATNRSGCYKVRRSHHRKKFGGGGARFTAPLAPRNTTSFIIRAKKSGGIASLVSPCSVTPAILSTPSPWNEVLGDMAEVEWGLDGYGSMNGLIRLRSGKEDNSDEDDVAVAATTAAADSYSVSDVEERVEFEKRLDHDLSRYEIIYPNCPCSVSDSYSIGDGNVNSNSLENKVDEQDTHIAQLEEENLTLKERIFYIETELGELRKRVQCLEADGVGGRCRREGASALDLAGDVCSDISVKNVNDNVDSDCKVV